MRTACLILIATSLGVTEAAASLVVWDPPDTETGFSSPFRLDNGESDTNTGNTALVDAADFQISPVSGRVGPRFRTEGLEFGTAPIPVSAGAGVFTGTGVATNEFGALRRLAPGEPIGGNLDFATGASVYNVTGAFSQLDWNRGDNGYAGLELSIDGQTHYGWAELTLSDAIGGTR